jgi:hypothetical protein
LIRIAVCQTNRQFYFAGESGKGVAFLNGKRHVLKIKKMDIDRYCPKRMSNSFKKS